MTEYRIIETDGKYEIEHNVGTSIKERWCIHAMDYAYGENYKLRYYQQDTIEDARAAIRLRVADDAYKEQQWKEAKAKLERRRVVT